jgi:pimeloyl-ACP methyl ester carboxylesterase
MGLNSSLERLFTPPSYSDKSKSQIPPEKAHLTLQGIHPGEPRTRTLLFNPKDFGFETDVVKLTMEQVLIPVHVNRSEVVVRVLQKPKFSLNSESDEQEEDGEQIEKTGITWIHIGGGGSQDTPHIGDIVVRTREALEDSNFTLNNFVVLGHPSTTVRTKVGSEAFDKDDFSDSAKALKQVLENPEIKVSGKVILTGFSSGGAVATVLATEYPNIDALVLMDPAGMGEHRNLAINFAIIDPVRVYQSYRKDGNSRKEAMQLAWSGVQKSMSTGKGMPRNIFELFTAFYPDETHKGLIKSFGLDGDSVSSGPRIDLLSEDSTAVSRQKLKNKKMQIIISPAMGAIVANFLWVKHRWTEETMTKALDNPESEEAKEIIAESENTIKEMFPPEFDQQLHFVPWWESTHMSVAIEQKYLDRIVKELEKVLH